MIRPAAKPRPRIQPAKVTTIPAPVKGWNARDSLGDMDRLDAVQLTNLFPATTSVNVRLGKTAWATGLPGQVETLMHYSGGATSKFYAASVSGIYDITAGGAVGAAKVSGLSNARWQYANLANTAGAYLCGVNGADKQVIFDGTNWHRDGDGAPYDITGVDSSTLIDVQVFKSRFWYVKKNTLEVWYLGVNAIGGAATKLDLSGIFQNGGHLVSMGTWTFDGGYGSDDYAVWVTSEGEVAMYQLTDPTTPTGIKLIGIWRVGAPIGQRCLYKYKADLLLICQDGVDAMSRVFQSGRGEGATTITDRIQWAISNSVSLYGSYFGWQMMFIPKLNQFYLNVPVQAGSSQQQYVMNSISGAWCNFTGWDANCWETFGDHPYYGGNTIVYKAWSGYDDAGNDIQTFGLQAFNHFGNTLQKQFTLIRPMLFTNGSPTIYGGINTDFNVADPTSPLSFSTTSYAVWDTALWDSAIWGGDLSPQNVWQGVTGTGYWGAVVLKTATSGIETQWVSTDIVYRTGTVL